MELRAFIHIFIQHGKLLWGIIALCIVVGMLLYIAQPERYSTSLTLNVARAGVTPETDENFAGFYRLQADERFGDTIVRWLESPRVVENILVTAGDAGTQSEKALRAVFNGTRLSSQVVEVQYVSATPEQAAARAASILTVLNALTDELNVDDEGQWFRILGEEPIIRPYEKSFGFALTLSILVGLFIGFLSVLFWHYWKQPTAHSE